MFIQKWSDTFTVAFTFFARNSNTFLISLFFNESKRNICIKHNI